MLFTLLLLTSLAVPQIRPAQAATPQRPATQPAETDKPDAPLPLDSPVKMLKFQHDEVKKEVGKLVKLVTEVQEEVEKAGENVLPLSTLKKLDEVEKQARKVRSRLKQ